MTPPFRVKIVDQFQGNDEYGYDEVATCDKLKDAIAIAKNITKEGIEGFNTIKVGILGKSNIPHAFKQRLCKAR